MYLTTKNQGRQKQAMDIKKESRQRYESIRNDPTLSPEGQRRELAKVWWRTKQQLTQLEGSELNERKRRRESLRKELFGSSTPLAGADVISVRDAADRTSRIGSQDEAMRLLDSARTSGDTVLAQAIARRAFSQQWVGALEHWADGDAQVEGKVNELYELESAGGNSTRGIAELLSHGMAFGDDKPSELQGLPDSSLSEYVGESVTDYGAAAVASTQFGQSTKNADYAPNDPRLPDSTGQEGSASETGDAA